MADPEPRGAARAPRVLLGSGDLILHAFNFRGSLSLVNVI